MIADWSMAALAQLMVSVLGVGVFVGSRRFGAEVARATRMALGVIVALELWLVFAALLAVRGVLSNWSTLPPRWPLLPLGAFIAIALVTRTAAATRIIAHIPVAWPIAAQSFRVGVELTGRSPGCHRRSTPLLKAGTLCADNRDGFSLMIHHLEAGTAPLKRVSIPAREAAAERVRPRFSRSLPITTTVGPSDREFLQKKEGKKSPISLT